MRGMTVVVAALLVVAISACGGGTKTVLEHTTTVTTGPSPSASGSANYKPEVEAAAQEFKRVSVDAGAKLRAATNKEEFSAGVDEFQGAVSTFTEKLKSLSPPPGAVQPQQHLIDVLNQFSSDVGAVRSALNAGDTAKITDLQTKVQSDVATIQVAARDLESAAG